jgi:predicted neutral ceramidase superfamily lipid hydrolase
MTFILTTLTNAFAQRLIVLKDFKVNEAMKKALLISRRTVLASILTGIINFAFKTIVGIAGIILIALFIGLPSYLIFTTTQSNPLLSAILVIFTALSFLIFVFISSVAGAALNVFSYSNWNQLFNEYFADEGGNKNE